MYDNYKKKKRRRRKVYKHASTCLNLYLINVYGTFEISLVL